MTINKVMKRFQTGSLSAKFKLVLIIICFYISYSVLYTSQI